MTATTLALAAGDPTDIYKVRSPGGFPPGVSANRLLATQSEARNPGLAEAMRVLGLADREDVGIDSMYRVMLRDGHPEPEIVEDGGEVVVRLPAGSPDLRLREYFDRVSKRRRSLAEDVRASIGIEILCRQPVVRPEGLAAASQATPADVARTLANLEQAGAVERLLKGSLSYRLTKEARGALGHRLKYRRRTALDERMDQLGALLDVLAEVGRADLIGHLWTQRGSGEPCARCDGGGGADRRHHPHPARPWDALPTSPLSATVSCAALCHRPKRQAAYHQDHLRTTRHSAGTT